MVTVLHNVVAVLHNVVAVLHNVFTCKLKLTSVLYAITTFMHTAFTG